MYMEVNFLSIRYTKSSNLSICLSWSICWNGFFFIIYVQPYLGRVYGVTIIFERNVFGDSFLNTGQGYLRFNSRLSSWIILFPLQQ